MSDTLASIGQALRPEEFVSYILNGLDENYDSLVESVLSRETPLSIHDLYAQLLSTEQRIERRQTTDIISHSANFARSGSHNFRASNSPRSRNKGKSGASTQSVRNPSAARSEDKAGRIHGQSVNYVTKLVTKHHVVLSDFRKISLVSTMMGDSCPAKSPWLIIFNKAKHLLIQLPLNGT